MDIQVETPSVIDVTGTTIPTTDTTVAADAPAAPAVPTMDEIKLMLQKEGDRRVTPVANELKKTKEALEALQKSAMTDAQRQKYEADQERERLLTEKSASEEKLAHYMTQAELNKRGWDTSLTKFVLASTEEDVAANADSLQKLIDVEVQKKLTSHLAKSGIVPTTQKSSNTTQSSTVDMNDPAAVYEAVKAGKMSLFTP